MSDIITLKNKNICFCGRLLDENTIQIVTDDGIKTITLNKKIKNTQGYEVFVYGNYLIDKPDIFVSSVIKELNKNWIVKIDDNYFIYIDTGKIKHIRNKYEISYVENNIKNKVILSNYNTSGYPLFISSSEIIHEPTLENEEIHSYINSCQLGE